jgi:hypothetical protein
MQTYTPSTIVSTGGLRHVAWANASSIVTGGSATVTLGPSQVSGQLQATGFGVAAQTSPPLGLQVLFGASDTPAPDGQCQDLTVTLLRGGGRIVGAVNRAAHQEWTGQLTYGVGQLDTWGLVLTWDLLSDPTFGVTATVNEVLGGTALAATTAISLIVYW